MNEAKSMIRVCLVSVLLLGAVLVPNDTSALSCMRPDLAKTMEDAKASDKVYHVLVGRFTTSKKDRRPEETIGGGPFKPRPTLTAPAMFTGISLSPTSRSDYYLRDFPVDIETSCAAHWCGSLPDASTDQIAFVESRAGRSPLLRISACPSHVFRVELKKVQLLRECFDKTCQSDLPDRY